jgi:hypothetical protein
MRDRFHEVLVWDVICSCRHLCFAGSGIVVQRVRTVPTESYRASAT